MVGMVSLYCLCCPLLVEIESLSLFKNTLPFPIMGDEGLTLAHPSVQGGQVVPV